MPRRKQPPNPSPQQPQRVYDSALKGLMDDYAAEIISELLPGTYLESEANSEIERESIRADLVYKVKRHGQPHVLNMELQSGSDTEMAHRMLLYHVELYLDYLRPVLSVVLYLFESSLPETPFREMSGDQSLLTMEYQVIAVWKMDAQTYVRQGIIHMYMFLPAMKNANASLLLQAVHEMKQRYSRIGFAKHLTRFMYILRRSTTVSEQDKQRVEEALAMEYDSMIDDNPVVQERVAKSRAEGKAEGELQGLQLAILDAVQDEFPSLIELAEEKAPQIDEPDELRKLIRLIYKAPDEDTARWLLNNYAA
ncbi:MAG: hypothetical protein WCD86_10075 [Ktedonobacteraceae bacterium]